MRWLIVEDALRDRKGHWHEYVAMFVHELRALGDSVDVLATCEADAFLVSELGAKPVLPPSLWHRLGDGAGGLVRLLRFPGHALATYRAMSRYLRERPNAYDVIFVPTVSAHHLLGWAPVVRRLLPSSKTRVLLFFIQLPAQIDHATGQPAWLPSPTSRALNLALGWLRPAVGRGQVMLGAEPEALRHALATLSGLPATLFPQPVHRHVEPVADRTDDVIRLACYGAARAEKGSDLLQQAMRCFLERNPSASVRFALQWVDDFVDDAGNAVTLDPRLTADPRVEIIPRYFEGNEYSEHLARTDVMLLPYQLRAYQLRGSRVAVEAMVNGIPVVATRGSTFADQLAVHGAAVEFDDGNQESLIAAMTEAVARFQELRSRAQARRAAAREYYSVAAFRSLLKITPTESSPGPIGPARAIHP